MAAAQRPLSIRLGVHFSLEIDRPCSLVIMGYLSSMIAITQEIQTDQCILLIELMLSRDSIVELGISWSRTTVVL